mmetsp:Transcript_15192/g.18490  ORF Transcript_15192/g.18490 Transcript_15192/m.18490 type:complete len:275 (+) Transcript_15192:34-858(+)
MWIHDWELIWTFSTSGVLSQYVGQRHLSIGHSAIAKSEKWNLAHPRPGTTPFNRTAEDLSLSSLYVSLEILQRPRPLFPQMGSTSILMFWYWPRTTPLLTNVGITRLMQTGPFQRSDQCLLVVLGTDRIQIPRFDHGMVHLLVHAGTRPADACSESDPWVWSRTPWSKPTSSSNRPTSAPASLPRACWPASLILVHIDRIRMSKLGGSNTVGDTVGDSVGEDIAFVGIHVMGLGESVEVREGMLVGTSAVGVWVGLVAGWIRRRPLLVSSRIQC